MQDDAHAVRIRALSRSFGKVTALDGITADIRKGGITGLVGPDAAGKTTLMRIMAGLLLQDGGSIEIFGMTPAAMQEKHPECIGYMPQRFGLYEDLSVRANLELHARLRGLGEAEQETIFARLLASVTPCSADSVRVAPPMTAFVSFVMPYSSRSAETASSFSCFVTTISSSTASQALSAQSVSASTLRSRS